MKFKAGKSGNPGGRPKADIELRELARKQTRKAVRVLTEIMSDKKAQSRARVLAATVLLDRAWGKPRQEITGAGGAPLIPHTPADATELAKRVAFLLAAGLHASGQPLLPVAKQTT
jgi:hypothetical protein